MTGVIGYSPKLMVYVLYSLLHVKYRGESRIFQRRGGGGGEGNHTVLNRRYSPDCHVNIHGMFYLKEGLQRGSWAYRTPLSPPAMAF